MKQEATHSIDGNVPSPHREAAPRASSSDASHTLSVAAEDVSAPTAATVQHSSSTQPASETMAGTCASRLVPVLDIPVLCPPEHWFDTSRRELMSALWQLCKADWCRCAQPRQTDADAKNVRQKASRAPSDVRPPRAGSQVKSGPRVIPGIGMEYTTRDVARLCGTSPQTIIKRVNALVERKWLEERCTRRWTFDEVEARLIEIYPRGKGPLKN